MSKQVGKKQITSGLMLMRSGESSGSDNIPTLPVRDGNRHRYDQSRSKKRGTSNRAKAVLAKASNPMATNDSNSDITIQSGIDGENINMPDILSSIDDDEHAFDAQVDSVTFEIKRKKKLGLDEDSELDIVSDSSDDDADKPTPVEKQRNSKRAAQYEHIVNTINKKLKFGHDLVASASAAPRPGPPDGMAYCATGNQCIVVGRLVKPGNHECVGCKMPIHAICGKTSTQGYGGQGFCLGPASACKGETGTQQSEAIDLDMVIEVSDDEKEEEDRAKTAIAAARAVKRAAVNPFAISKVSGRGILNVSSIDNVPKFPPKDKKTVLPKHVNGNNSSGYFSELSPYVSSDSSDSSGVQIPRDIMMERLASGEYIISTMANYRSEAWKFFGYVVDNNEGLVHTKKEAVSVADKTQIRNSIVELLPTRKWSMLAMASPDFPIFLDQYYRVRKKYSDATNAGHLIPSRKTMSLDTERVVMEVYTKEIGKLQEQSKYMGTYVQQELEELLQRHSLDDKQIVWQADRGPNITAALHQYDFTPLDNEEMDTELMRLSCRDHCLHNIHKPVFTKMARDNNLGMPEIPYIAMEYINTCKKLVPFIKQSTKYADALSSRLCQEVETRWMTVRKLLVSVDKVFYELKELAGHSEEIDEMVAVLDKKVGESIIDFLEGLDMVLLQLEATLEPTLHKVISLFEMLRIHHTEVTENDPQFIVVLKTRLRVLLDHRVSFYHPLELVAVVLNSQTKNMSSHLLANYQTEAMKWFNYVLENMSEIVKGTDASVINLCPNGRTSNSRARANKTSTDMFSILYGRWRA
ncbi:hypothetical protein SARC_02907 [Sphaeroforma arctica JP610]|uniref:SCAN domain-containing protein n=1 Tax=Sphaeroforma arctica JP610 TaxID=667725 RepID=A0A0L0G7K1_9EUKA|nr:hypothetical protein SARC_02907 [Sphaeroforma arctica JP610]KNC84899.1 hypothetical protein SARC_02907 [Sphaeroforma arctica JP610]|eukprot:XP_014158801.1 hypothetical protein SARC_02907 [Sphaeroforma arctica JP610]